MPSGNKQRHTIREATMVNGFGLYDPSADIFQPQPPPRPGDGINDIWTADELKQHFAVSEAERRQLAERMCAVLHDNADYEYVANAVNNDIPKKVRLGELTEQIYPMASSGMSRYSGSNIQHFPLSEEWIKAAGEFAHNPFKMEVLLAPAANYNYPVELLPWFKKRFKDIIVDVDLSDTPGWNIASWNMLRHVCPPVDPRDMFKFALKAYRSLMAMMDVEEWTQPCCKPGTYLHASQDPNDLSYSAQQHFYISSWRRNMWLHARDDEDFTEFIKQMWNDYLLCGRSTWFVQYTELFRAYNLGIIPKDVVYEQLTSSPNAAYTLEMLCDRQVDDGWGQRDGRFVERYPVSRQIAHEVIERVVTMEEQRGDEDTPASPLAAKVGSVFGVVHFIRLLAALPKGDFYRPKNVRHNENPPHYNKRQMLCSLLKVCYPLESDTAAQLKELAQYADISDKRLAEAAMFAPQWARMVEEAIGWDGLECGVWLFHAHVGEFTYSTTDIKHDIARFASINRKDIDFGIFDAAWFWRAYRALGKQRFQLLYKHAKYITGDNTSHRRIQLFTDAVLGRLERITLEQDILKNRNLDKLMCYPLLPFAIHDNDSIRREAQARYEFILAFGEQRKKRCSWLRYTDELFAIDAAMANLATNAGYADVESMTWALDSLDVARVAGQQEAWQARVLAALEDAMVTGREFAFYELVNMFANLQLRKYVQTLVWMCGTTYGLVDMRDKSSIIRKVGCSELPKKGGLVEVWINSIFSKNQKLRIAHPYHMLQQGNLEEWQRELSDSGVTQPFDQVFRKYYTLTEDEKETKTYSNRYLGCQPQPEKTMQLLKSRGWAVGDNLSMQNRRWQDSNGLVVGVSSKVEWLPATKEQSPTLDVLSFCGLSGNMDLQDVPPIIFSEVIRDLEWTLFQQEGSKP